MNDFDNINKDNIEHQIFDTEIFINFFIRNKKIIGIFTFIFFIASLIFLKFSSKIWEGQFDIVLKQTNKNFKGNIQSAFQSINSDVGGLGEFNLFFFSK